MALRKMKLSDGWYPHRKEGIEEYVEAWEKNAAPLRGEAAAGVVPHAGLFYSGEEAWRIIREIPVKTETVIIAGGHLPPGISPMCWTEDEYETPFGNMKMDKALFEELCIDMPRDTMMDNTIEIQLPLLACRNRNWNVLALRLPPESDSYEWGKNAAHACSRLGIRAFFLGSTDLTHYGSSYGNTMYSDRNNPVECVARQDDELLGMVAAGDVEGTLGSVNSKGTACSIGGALGAAGFADYENRLPGAVLSRTGSYEKTGRSGDFVEYGTVLF